MMQIRTNLPYLKAGYPLVLIGFLTTIGLLSMNLAQAQPNNQALSQDELQQINNQPLSPPVSAAGALNSPGVRKPSFQHKEAIGTEITEYKDANSPTQVEVKTKYTTYEMSPPDSVKPGIPTGEGSLLSVPSISIPF